MTHQIHQHNHKKAATNEPLADALQMLLMQAIFRNDNERGVIEVVREAVDKNRLSGCDIAGLRSLFGLKPESGSMEIECELTVDYDLSMSDMIEAAEPHAFNRHILNETLPTRNTGKIGYEVLLKRFETSATDEMIDAFAEKEKYRLGRAEHVIALSIERPQIHGKFAVMAPGSIRVDAQSETAVLLSATEGGQSEFRLTFKECSVGWPQPFLIMFVRKKESVE